MDKILIKDLRLQIILGIYARERTSPQEVVINITIFTDTRVAAASDNITDCIDYEKIANQVKNHAEVAQRQTVEALAEDIANICLAAPGAQKTLVKIEKTEAISFTASVGVEIERTKEIRP